MALVVANDIGVVSGSIVLPLNGVWTADLLIDQPDGTGFDAGTAVTISADGGIELKGAVAPDRSAPFLDAVHVRVLGGKAKLGNTASARSYVSPGATVNDVLTGILGDVGESASSTISSSILTTNLDAWSVFKQPASHAIGQLLDVVFPGQGWRVLTDGTFWTGAESWSSSTPQYDILEQAPEVGEYLLGVDTFEIVPGTTIDGIGKINRVEYAIGEGRVRARVFVQLSDSDRGDRAAIAAIARQEMAGIDHYAFYDARVDAQSADGATVDITPADTRLAGMQHVPLRLGLPGCVVKFATGATVRLGWDRGDPRRPFCSLWNGGETVNELVLNAALIELADTTGAQFVALSNKVDTAIAALVTYINNHTHPYALGTTSTPTAPPLSSQPSTAAAKVKAV